MRFAFASSIHQWPRLAGAGASSCPTGRRAGAGASSYPTGRRAFTLIELLIALVVLMIGVYGMLRVFPSGYMAVEASQQQTAAAQLADAELARWKLDPEILPDAVLATDYNGKVIAATLTDSRESLAKDPAPLLTFAATKVATPGDTDYKSWPLTDRDLALLNQAARPLLYSPTDLTPSQFDTVQKWLDPDKPTTDKRPLLIHPNWEPNSLFLPRTIVGERIDLRSLPQTGLGVPFYLLSHAPCDMLRREKVTGPVNVPGQATTRDVYFDIYDARPWTFVQPGTAPGLRQYSLDNTNALVVYPLFQARQFRVDYTDLNSQTRERIIGATVTVDRGQPTSLPLGGTPDPLTMQVYERLIAMADQDYTDITQGTAGFMPDATDDTVWPRNAYYVNNLSTVTGQILFSPALQVKPKPTDITIAKVDYRVADWQILVFDVQVPAGGMVQLPIRNIKSGSYSNPPRQPRPQSIAVGVRRVYDSQGNDVTVPATDSAWRSKTAGYVVAVDRQSGDILTDNEGIEWPISPWMRRSRFRVDYTHGLLYFNYSADTPEIKRSNSFNKDVDTPDRSGRTYRIFCRAQNDWAVQLMVASRVYARSENASPSGSGVGLGGSPSVTMLAYAWTPNQTDKRMLYFPLSESGQTVAVDYYYNVGDTNNLRQVFVSGEVHTIGAPYVNTSPKEWVCQLSEPLAHAPNTWGPTSVRGISLRARSTWVTTGRSTTFQDIVQSAVERGIGSAVRTAPARLNESWHQVIISTYLTRAPI